MYEYVLGYFINQIKMFKLTNLNNWSKNTTPMANKITISHEIGMEPKSVLVSFC